MAFALGFAASPADKLVKTSTSWYLETQHESSSKSLSQDVHAAVLAKPSPSRNPFLKRRGRSRRYLMRPVPVVFLRMAFTLQLSAGSQTMPQLMHLPSR